MHKEDIKKIEEQLVGAISWWPYFEKYYNILKDKVKYTNKDIDELLTYYSQREKYEVCERLIKLKK